MTQSTSSAAGLPPTTSRRDLAGRIALGLLGLIAIGLIIWLVDLKALMRGLLEWIEAAGPLGHLLFILAVTLAIPLMIPNSWLELAAGILFPYPLALLYIIVAETIGSTLAFLAAGHLMGEAFRQRLRRHAKFDLISRVLTHEGWRTVALTRLMPMFPFKASNWGYGLTHLPVRPFVLGTFLGIIPRCALVVYAGRLLGDIAAIGREQTERGPLQWGLLIGGLIVTAIGVGILARNAQKIMRQRLNENESTPAGH